ncbi:MAG: apolipoprotein N-acyltransferase, partial [Alphaproteobacteria bacterium]|nr:apolipoprotein N-acyltransferase [Alphaproteobacteria bacterium]
MIVYVDIHDKRWKKYKIDFQKIVNAIGGKKYQQAEVSIILTDDKEIQQINRDYRNIDKPTNVLSFELGDDVLLGDIYISFDTVKKEAIAENISFEDHCAHMVVHGVLHLMGYDHIKDKDAIIMENKETKILAKMGIKNPYASDNVLSCADGSCCPGGKIISWMKKHKIKENSFLQYVLYAVFGGIASFGFAPFYQWWCTLIGVAGAYWLTIRNTDNSGFWRTLLRVSPFGAMYCLSMFWWTLHSIYVVPELTSQYAIWTLPGVIGLLLAGVAIFSWPFIAIKKYKCNKNVRPVLFACVWVLVLWAREWMFTGFPWNPIANIMINVPMIANSMSLWGALGLSFVIVGLCASFIELLLNKTKSSFILFSILIVVGCAFGYKNMSVSDFGAADEKVMLRIIQPGKSQMQKATHNRADALKTAEYNLRQLFDLASVDGNVDIVVLPETTYPFVVLPDDVIDFAKQLSKPVIMGTNTFGPGGVYNSMVITDKYGDITKIYNKSHLVPFGEYKPLGFLPAPVDMAQGDGPEIISVNNFVFVPAICYEIIFSDSLIPYGQYPIDAIINITNDNWFGN